MKKLLMVVLVVILFCSSLLASDKWYNRYYLSVASDTAADSIYTTGYYTFYMKGQRTLIGQAIMGDVLSGYAGVGNDDSCWIWLYTTLGGNSYLIDSAVSGSLPCTLNVSVTEAIGDTLLRDELYLKYLIYDSLSDTVLTFQYPFYWNFLLK